MTQWAETGQKGGIVKKKTKKRLRRLNQRLQDKLEAMGINLALVGVYAEARDLYIGQCAVCCKPIFDGDPHDIEGSEPFCKQCADPFAPLPEETTPANLEPGAAAEQLGVSVADCAEAAERFRELAKEPLFEVHEIPHSHPKRTGTWTLVESRALHLGADATVIIRWRAK